MTRYNVRSDAADLLAKLIERETKATKNALTKHQIKGTLQNPSRCVCIPRCATHRIHWNRRFEAVEQLRQSLRDLGANTHY